MADDLAARIGEGAVAVLELVPGEKQFADLSEYVLRGGAARFRPVVLSTEPITYVLPVGVPRRRLIYGALLIQPSRVALVWRTDPSKPSSAVMCDLGPETSLSQSAATIRGETWGRFDIRDERSSMTFLVPPVSSTDLPKALYRTLIQEPGTRVARMALQPLPDTITNPTAFTEQPARPTKPAVESTVMSASISALSPASPTTEPTAFEAPTDVPVDDDATIKRSGMSDQNNSDTTIKRPRPPETTAVEPQLQSEPAQVEAAPAQPAAPIKVKKSRRNAPPLPPPPAPVEDPGSAVVSQPAALADLEPPQPSQGLEALFEQQDSNAVVPPPPSARRRMSTDAAPLYRPTPAKEPIWGPVAAKAFRTSLIATLVLGAIIFVVLIFV